MNQRITRRKFGQLVLAGTAVAGITSFASRIAAQTVPTLSSSMLVGVSVNRLASSATTLTNQVVVQTLDLTTNQVQSQTNISVQSLATNQFEGLPEETLLPYRQLGGLTIATDGTRIQSSNPVGGSQQANPSRLTFTNMDSSSRTINVSGLDPRDALWSVLATNDGSLIGLVGKKNGSLPYRLANINIQTGQLNFIDFTLPPNEWFNNLTQCENGNIYTVSAGFGGGATVVQLDLKQRELIRLPQLSLDGVDWSTGLNSLACADDKVYAFGNPNKYDPRRALYTVDLSTGFLTKQIDLDYDKITFSRS